VCVCVCVCGGGGCGGVGVSCSVANYGRKKFRTMYVKLFRSHFTESATTALESCGIQDNTQRKMSCLAVTCIYRMEQNNSEKLSGMVEGTKFRRGCPEMPCFNPVQR
jgi:hypothetical protein